MGSSHWNTSYQKLIEMEFNVALFFRTAPGNVHIAFISFLPFQMNLTGKFSSVIFHVLDTRFQHKNSFQSCKENYGLCYFS